LPDIGTSVIGTSSPKLASVSFALSTAAANGVA
jgi:hypothetical protein